MPQRKNDQSTGQPNDWMNDEKTDERMNGQTWEPPVKESLGMKLPQQGQLWFLSPSHSMMAYDGRRLGDEE